MAPSESRRTIGVFSHGGTKNLGDEALIAAVIQNVRLRVPGAEVIGFTINPRDTRERHGITCFPIRRINDSSSSGPPPSSVPSGSGPGQSPRTSRLKRLLKAIPGLRVLLSGLRRFIHLSIGVLAEPKFLLNSYRCLKSVELLLVAGSQQLNDGYGGAWGFPFTLYKWSLLARLADTKVAILSVGAGPISSPLSKFFFRRALQSAGYRSYRDALSSRLVETMGVHGDNPVYPDLVYSLRLPEPIPVVRLNDRTIVGTNPVPFFDGRYWPEPNPGRYGNYVNKMAQFAQWLDRNGHSILFFPTQVRADALTIRDIRQAMNGSGGSANLLAGRIIQNLEDLVAEISRADLIVANRYHGILISIALGKPVLGIAYHEKSRALLEQVGQGQYVLNIAEFTVEELIAKFKSLKANAVAIRAQVAQRVGPLRAALDEQYDKVFALIGIAPAQAGARQAC